MRKKISEKTVVKQITSDETDPAFFLLLENEKPSNRNTPPPIKFYLNSNKPKKVKEVVLMCYVQLNRWHSNYKPLKFSTGIKINPQYWDKKKNRATGIFEKLNLKLDILKDNIFTVVKDVRENAGEVSDQAYIEAIKKEFENSLVGFEKHSQSVDLSNIKERIISAPIQNKETSRNKYDFKNKLVVDIDTMYYHDYLQYFLDNSTFKSGTYRRYKTFKSKVEQFHTENNFDFILLKDLTTEYFDSLSLWIMDKFDLDVESFDGSLRILKRSINYGVENEIKLPHINFKTQYLKKRSVKRGVKKSIAFNIEQLKKLIKMEFEPDQDEMRKARDLIVVGCLCGGLRISDLKRLNDIKREKNLITGEYFEYVEEWSTKTGAYVKLPLWKPVLDILQRNGGKVPKVKGLTKQLELVGLKAGFTQAVEKVKVKIKDLKMEFKTQPFYKYITSRIARKTFCSIMYTHFKLDAITIMAFSGHDTIDSFERYIADVITPNQVYEYAKFVAEDKTFE